MVGVVVSVSENAGAFSCLLWVLAYDLLIGCGSYFYADVGVDLVFGCLPKCAFSGFDLLGDFEWVCFGVLLVGGEAVSSLCESVKSIYHAKLRALFKVVEFDHFKIRGFYN
jgi:hypothetical protein